jgi:hypothetical protein
MVRLSCRPAAELIYGYLSFADLTNSLCYLINSLSPGRRPILSRRQLLEGAASLAAVSLIPGCGYHANGPTGPFATNPLPGAVQGSVAVMESTIGSIPSRFMGLSYEKLAMSYSYFHAANHNLIALFRRLGKGVLRIGGGSVDHILWTASDTGTHLQVSPANIRGLATFLQATDWLCIYGVNLATSNPAMAAEEAAYAAAILGPNLLGIEIGNEPDEYGVAGNFFAGAWTFEDFLSRWNLFRSAIIEAAPHIPITGPAVGGGNHISTWTVPFGQTVSSGEITLLTQHYYRASGASPSSTAAFLLTPDAQLATDLSTLQAGAQLVGIPYRLSECNSFFNGGAAGVSDSFASSLWVLDFLFNAAAGGATGVNLHGGGNGPGYTPIADDSGSVLEARPEYYGLLLFTLMGTGNLLETQLSVGDAAVTAYALRTESGDLNVMLVNKETQNLIITVEAGQTINSASMQSMTAPDLSATTGVTIQGASVDRDGSFAPAASITLPAMGSQTTCSIPGLSAALVSIT